MRPLTRYVLAVILVFILGGSAWAEYCKTQGSPALPKSQVSSSILPGVSPLLLNSRPCSKACGFLHRTTVLFPLSLSAAV
jgi:hypothetical protein